MALFEKEHFGKPISEELSSYLRAHTDKHDQADVSVRTGVGMSTIRDVAYRRSSLTENNSPAIIELMRVAIANCQMKITESNEAKRRLNQMLA